VTRAAPGIERRRPVRAEHEDWGSRMDRRDTYVLRIFRRSAGGPGDGTGDARARPARLVGVVEDPATGKRDSFHDREELWALLTAPGDEERGAT
jgi:hypothetical protein